MTKNVAVFAFDISEISQIRRIESFIRLGMKVTSYSMRRQNMNEDFVPSWPNIHLFYTENEKPIKRIMTIMLSWIKLCFRLKRLAQSDVIIARNFDMLLIALGAKLMLHIFGLKKNIDLVYECLDIHSYFCADGFRGRFARFFERLALRFTNRIIVSSPAFKKHYFQDMQDFAGDIYIVENKLVAAPSLRTKPQISIRSPIKIGLVGTIRCAPSVQILLAIARKHPSFFEIHFHGVIHSHSLPNFEHDILGLSNVYMHGPYNYYSDLKKIYQNLNYVWAQDLWQRNGNSMWLLPNRIYEAGYFGCPSIALSQSETGRKISRMGWGFCVDHIDVDIVSKKILSIGAREYSEICKIISNTPTSNFVQSDRDLLAFFRNDGAAR